MDYVSKSVICDRQAGAMVPVYKYMGSNNLEELAVLKFIVVQSSTLTVRRLD
jgi:hypothetical protein